MVICLRQPLNRLSISSAGLGQSQFLFKVNYADSRAIKWRFRLHTRADWEVVRSSPQALSSKLGQVVEGQKDLILSAYFRQTVQGIQQIRRFVQYMPRNLVFIYLNKEYLELFAEDGLARFEEVGQEGSRLWCLPCQCEILPRCSRQGARIYHPSPESRRFYLRNPLYQLLMPSSQQARNVWETQWRFLVMGPKREDYESSFGLYKIPRVTTRSIFPGQCQSTREVQPILGPDFEGLATIKQTLFKKEVIKPCH